ncbi:MAG: tetratricopeptide repeat protein [Bacteroidales bacterium]|nr:tetratricopeptide repeat protein [Bacteroidales bacterium]
MPSIIEGYNYDIFISYRQKDNKHDGWVTDFVNNLKGELESTFKEEISVYFDINPHDGLLETHDVDASLKEKLKCLVFIPILSRTYCDPKSFAWEHEFKAFVEEAKIDQFGLKVRLQNGNVANRVLPVRIHDLDPGDIKLCESVLGGVLRGIEFIYKSAGINRPLRAQEEKPHDNINKTIYRDQINKVALAIKEIILGLKAKSSGEVKETVPHSKRSIDKERVKKKKNARKIIWIGSLIINIIFILILINALKPVPFSEEDWILITDFENLTGDDVFNQSLNTALEVTIQQSSFVNVLPRTRINETLKRMGKENTEIINEDTGVEIAQREGIAVIVVCNISLIGNIYLLTAKVVEVNTRKVLKTEKFQANGKNEILISLDDLAREIRRDLGESLKEINHEIVALPEATTSSLEALKCLVKGNEAWNKDGKLNEAEVFYLKAIELDPEFAYAHASLGSLYYWMNNRTKGEEHFTKALNLLDRLTEKEKLWIQARIEGFRGNYEEAVLNYNIYLRNYPSSSNAWYRLGYNYMMLDRYEEAIAAFNKSLEIHQDKDPNAYINIATCYGNLEDFQQSVEFYLKAFAINPNLLTITNLNHEFGFTYVQMGEFQKAREVFEKLTAGEDDLKAQGYRSLALLLMYTGKFSEAIDLLHESILICKTTGYGVGELRNRLFLATALKTKGMMPEFYEELIKVNELLKAEGLEPWWYFLYGKLLIRDGKLQKAERILNEISVRINEGNRSDTAAFNILKGEIQLAKGNPAEAIELIKTGVNLRRDGYTLESLANYYYDTGDLDMAIVKYKEIIEIKGSLGWEPQEYWIKAHYNLGKIYEKKGNYEQAIKYYKDFLNIWKDADNDLPELIDTKSRLIKLREQEL